MNAQVGLRVRLCMGMAKQVHRGQDPKDVTQRHDFMDWVAGRIPVGTEGVLFQPKQDPKPGAYAPLAIKWDGFAPKEKTEFSSGLQEGQPLHYWLEAVGHESAVPTV